MIRCDFCGWYFKTQKQANIHSRLKHQQFGELPIFGQDVCPNCKNADTWSERAEVVDGGGNHQGDAYLYTCEDCQFEWVSPIERDE
jgi:rubredoxin